MAGFQKFGKLSTSGWDAKTQTQTITLGQHAQIGLWGGGPNGEDLDVMSANESICVVHEQNAPAGVAHMRQFVMTALRVGETKVNAFLPGTSSKYSEPITVKVVGQSTKKLVFFPGERMSGSATVGTIYAVGSGQTIEAAGGPPFGRKDAGGHTVDPTPPGKYVLGPPIRVVAPSWPKSVIPWGAALRLNPANEVEYEASPGKWIVATGKNGTVTQAKMSFEVRSGKKPSLTTVIAFVRAWFVDPSTRDFLWSTTWEWNDFGRIGYNLRSNGKPTAYFVHTTPEDEHASAQGKAVFLSNSHGCIHLVPSQLKMLADAGYLKEGVPLEVRPYTETGPPL